MLGGVVAQRPNSGPGGSPDNDGGNGNELGPGGPSPRAPRPAALPVGAQAVHVATLVAAFGVWAVLDRHLWFYGDEWDFLTRRGLHGAYFSLWAPHNEHWSVLPILLWRAVYSLFHLSTYWPYLFPLLCVHVAIVHLVWRRCLKQGADPWLATALAGVLALFGPGAEDLTWAFQIGFLGSLALGLLAWQLAERPPPVSHPWAADAADAAVAALALASLMCSTVGLATSAGLAVVIAARDGWRRVARVLSVPVMAYIVWFVLIGYQGLAGTGDSLAPDVFLRAPLFVAWNLADALGSTAALAVSGPALVVALAVWLLVRRRDIFGPQAGLLACVVSAVAFYGLAALGRDRISIDMSPSRYTYIGAALLMPVLAVMLSRYPTWQGSRARLARAALLCAVGVAGAVNLAGGVNFARGRANYVNGIKAQIVTTGALLREKMQQQRAVDRFPFRGSGDRAGYLTEQLVADLYRHHLLGPVAISSISPRQLEVDESWLDLVGEGRPLYASGFHVAVAGGFRLFTISDLPDALADAGWWPTAGHRCPVGLHRRRPHLTFGRGGPPEPGLGAPSRGRPPR